jgi:hypothetical protein
MDVSPCVYRKYHNIPADLRLKRLLSPSPLEPPYDIIHGLKTYWEKTLSGGQNGRRL